MEGVDYAMAMLCPIAISIVLQICFFVAGRQQVQDLTDRLLCIEDRADRLGHEVKSLVAALCALHRRNRVDVHSVDAMQDAGASEPLPPVEETKFDAESETESECAMRIKVKGWLDTAERLPMAKSAWESDSRIPTVSGRASNSDVHNNKSQTLSIFNRLRATRERLYRTSPYRDASPTEGDNVAPASSAQARPRGPQLTPVASSRQNVASYNNDSAARAAAPTHPTSRPFACGNVSKSLGAMPSREASSATTATPPDRAPPKTARARKTSAAKDTEPRGSAKTSSGSRFYSYVIEKSTRAAQGRSSMPCTPPPTPVCISDYSTHRQVISAGRYGGITSSPLPATY